MLKGQVFAEQTFTSDCFAHFINTFLNKHNGVTKGCELSNTSTSVTVDDGYFVIQGRFLQEIGGTTINTTPANEYCILVCEIDMSQENTESEFNQGTWKILKNPSSYPTLTQQDLENDGTIYQFEFARFQNTPSGIINFVDTRKFIDFDSIYTEIDSYIASLESNSTVVFKEANKELYPTADKIKLAGIATNATSNPITTLTGSITCTSASGGLAGYGSASISYPAGYTMENCIVVGLGIKQNDVQGYNFVGHYINSMSLFLSSFDRYLNLESTGVALRIENPTDSELTFNYKIVLMKIV